MTMPRPPRWFVADDIVFGRVDLDGYPFTFIRVTASPQEMVGSGFGGKAAFAAMVDKVLGAAEVLEARGWQVVNFESSGREVYLRRPPR